MEVHCYSISRFLESHCYSYKWQYSRRYCKNVYKWKFRYSATFSNNFNVNSSQVIQVGDSFNSQWYEGLIDQGRIFPSELSASDILDLYNETGP